MACVIYSYLNCLETLYLFKTGIRRNFSDRFLAKMSGTTIYGNYLDNVADTARHYGLVDENRWADVAGGWDDYYKEIPQEIKNEALEFNETWLQYREWVNGTNDMFLALKMSPLQVTVRYASGNGILNPAGIQNHAVMIFNAEKDSYWEIFDTYTQSLKKYAWNYDFGFCLKPSLIKKTNSMTKLKENTLCQSVQGRGEFGLYIKGNMVVDDLDKIIASFLLRTGGDLVGMTKALTLEEWEKYPQINLKGDKI
jgi:hypothetical protein